MGSNETEVSHRQLGECPNVILGRGEGEALFARIGFLPGNWATGFAGIGGVYAHRAAPMIPRREAHYLVRHGRRIVDVAKQEGLPTPTGCSAQTDTDVSSGRSGWLVDLPRLLPKHQC